ncbi:hypothetical protein DFS34DRAFT_641357 [Phlyctochytrium arcticum]|nr:hypothetical protein DFS34DRAFT_641357 [Phlyctochytrium arcticum]
MSKITKQRKPVSGKESSEPSKDAAPSAALHKVQQDMPRKYRALLAGQKFSKRKGTVRKDGGADTTSTKPKSSKGGIAKSGQGGAKSGTSNSVAQPTRKPNESLGDFSRRVDDLVRQSITSASQAGTKRKIKSKAYLERRKQKAKASKAGGGGKDSDDEEREGQTEHIKFGTVAMQPPTITAVPKKRGGGGSESQKALLKAALQKSIDAQGSDADEEPKMPAFAEPVIPTVGRKRKLKTLPEVEKRAILQQREDAIAAYRAQKAAKGQHRRERASSDEEEEEDVEFED